MYGLGTVLWEVWSGEEPWAGLYGRDYYNTLVKEKRKLPLGEEHRDIAALLDRTFSFHPEHRPSATQVGVCMSIYPRCV